MDAVFLPSMCFFWFVPFSLGWKCKYVAKPLLSKQSRTYYTVSLHRVHVFCTIHVCIIKWRGIWMLWHGVYRWISNNHFNRIKIILQSLESIYANLGYPEPGPERNSMHTHTYISIGLSASTSYQHKCFNGTDVFYCHCYYMHRALIFATKCINIFTKAICTKVHLLHCLPPINLIKCTFLHPDAFQ